jgi:hypothetical protein
MKAACAPLGPRLPIACLAFLAGCGTYQPPPPGEMSFLERARTKSEAGITVSAAALTAPESKAQFGVDMAGGGVQPVWLRIENHDGAGYWFAPVALDPNYFSAGEVADMNSFMLSSEARADMEAFLRQQSAPTFVSSGSSAAGFVYTPIDWGAKATTVLLIGDHEQRQIDFVLPVPNIDADWMAVDFDDLYPPDQIQTFEVGNEAALRSAIDALPCCTTDREGRRNGDPLNFALIGHFETVMAALTRAGWDETATLTASSALKTFDAFLFRQRYRNSPVSPLYVFGRHQDAAFQKSRETISRRNHLRLWLTPLTYGGLPVWIGQISRDVGVRFTSKTWHLTTHAIDADLDAERWYLVQDLLWVEAVARMGFAEGVGISRIDEPRSTFGGDPYFTDGLRAVLFIADDPVGSNDVDQLEWASPPTGAERAALLGGE